MCGVLTGYALIAMFQPAVGLLVYGALLLSGAEQTGTTALSVVFWLYVTEAVPVVLGVLLTWDGFGLFLALAKYGFVFLSIGRIRAGDTWWLVAILIASMACNLLRAWQQYEKGS